MSYCSYDENSFLHYIDENKLFSCITSITFAVIGVFLYIHSAYTFFEKRNIPRGVLPSAPFGNIKEVLFQNTTLYVYLWKYYNRFKRKGFRYGGLYLFLKPSVLIVNPTLRKNILSEEKCLTDVYRKKYVHDSTKIAKLFSDKTVDRFLTLYKDSLITHLKGDGDCVTTVMHNFFLETTCSAFGFKSSSEIIYIINDLLKEKSYSNFVHYFRLVYPVFKRNKSDQEVQKYLKNIMEYRKKNDIREMDVIQGFIDVLNDGSYSLENITEEFFDIFADNIIYSYSTLLFCLYELASNDDIQQELVGEIRRFKKKNKPINLSNLQQLVYLDAVVKETLRKYPPVPLIIKECKEDYKVTEFDLDLPRGSFIIVSVFGIHHDLENFVDPEKFDPDRFSDENREFIKPDTYIPFGCDLRSSIGVNFTTVHIKLGLISILSSFKVNVNKNHSLMFDPKKLSISPKEPLPFSFEPLYS